MAGFKYLFGGDSMWSKSDWTSSDDRVRGGASQSYLLISTPSTQPPPTYTNEATFKGELDIKTLGGAGFASQRTTGEDRVWDLSSYDGLELDLGASDGKKYTLILKDELLPKSDNGREQSTVSWEWDFAPPAKLNVGRISVPWSEFKPTYRGRPKEDAKPLDLENIKRISVMMRSFFAKQEGSFEVVIKSIAAVKIDEKSMNEKDFAGKPGQSRKPNLVDRVMGGFFDFIRKCC